MRLLTWANFNEVVGVRTLRVVVDDLFVVDDENVARDADRAVRTEIASGADRSDVVLNVGDGPGVVFDDALDVLRDIVFAESRGTLDVVVGVVLPACFRVDAALTFDVDVIT